METYTNSQVKGRALTQPHPETAINDLCAAVTLFARELVEVGNAYYKKITPENNDEMLKSWLDSTPLHNYKFYGGANLREAIEQVILHGVKIDLTNHKRIMDLYYTGLSWNTYLKENTFFTEMQELILKTLQNMIEQFPLHKKYISDNTELVVSTFKRANW